MGSNYQTHVEQEIRMGIAADLEKGWVLMEFGAPIKWLHLPPDHARNVAALLLEAAAKVDEKIIGLDQDSDMGFFRKAFTKHNLFCSRSTIFSYACFVSAIAGYTFDVALPTPTLIVGTGLTLLGVITFFFTGRYEGVKWSCY